MGFRFRDNKRRIKMLRELAEGRIYELSSKIPTGEEVESFNLTRNEIAQQASLIGYVYNLGKINLYITNPEDNSRKKIGVMEAIAA